MKIRSELFFLVALLCAALAGVQNIHAITVVVSNTADSGPGSLRSALASSVDGDTIDASGVSGTITLTSGELLVTTAVAIVGPGPAGLAVDGNANSRVFHIQKAGTVTISGLTITNGGSSGPLPVSTGGGLYNEHSTLTLSNCAVTGNLASSGGGIYNDGAAGNASLTITNCAISGNSAAGQGGGIYNDGGFSGNAAITILNSTISDNSSEGSDGGGIFNNGQGGLADLTIVNSTLSGNVARFNGGGIYNDCSIGGSGAIEFTHSTFSGNSAGKDWFGGAMYHNGQGGGSTTLESDNTILEAGTYGGTIFNSSGTVISHGYNLSSDGNGPNNGTTDLLNTNPMLGQLQNNGGATVTHALMPGSPAMDAGDPAFAPNNSEVPMIYDQRGVGFDRVANSRIDIGAFEVQTAGPTPSPTLEVRISVSPRSIKRGQDALFTVTSSHGPASQAVTVYCAMTGTATFGSDYTLSGAYGQITIPAGQSSGTVTLHAASNGLRRTKTATMTLTTGAGYTVPTLRKKSTVTIRK